MKDLLNIAESILKLDISDELKMELTKGLMETIAKGHDLTKCVDIFKREILSSLASYDRIMIEDDDIREKIENAITQTSWFNDILNGIEGVFETDYEAYLDSLDDDIEAITFSEFKGDSGWEIIDDYIEWIDNDKSMFYFIQTLILLNQIEGIQNPIETILSMEQ